MMITRNNYEEYFLLYTDNELSAAEKNAVEEFVNDNPDLRTELLTLQQLKMKPENDIIFNDKDLLLKETENTIIDQSNYEEYFLLYADNELSAGEMNMVERFLKNNPGLQQECSLLLKTKLEADNDIIFPGKEILYKKESRRFVLLPWMRIAAAAVVLLLIGLFVAINVKKNIDSSMVANNNNDKKGITKKLADNKTETKNSTVVTSSAIDSLNRANTSKQKLAINRTMIKMQSKKNIISPATQIDQKQSGDSIVNNDQAETFAANIKMSRSVEKITDAKRIDIVAPKTVVLNAADLSAPAQSNNEIADNNIDSEDKLYIANTSAKKNRLRGFFRKVSRAFNKTTHVGDENNDAILIGSFRVALK